MRIKSEKKHRVGDRTKKNRTVVRKEAQKRTSHCTHPTVLLLSYLMGDDMLCDLVAASGFHLQ